MNIRLIGANPGLRLFADEDRQPLAFVSAWRVDWSPHGQGNAIVLWHQGRTRVVCPSRQLGAWLADAFTRHFPEVRGLPWPEPEVALAPVEFDINLARGTRAVGGDIEVEIAGPMDHRLITVDDFDLGGSPHRLSTIYVPCRTGTLRIGGAPVAGEPRVTTTAPVSSTAFLADAEVWCHPH